MKFQFLESGFTKVTLVGFAVMFVAGILSLISVLITPNIVASNIVVVSDIALYSPLISSTSGSGTLLRILTDPIAVIELIALAWSSIYLFGLIVGKSAATAEGKIDSCSFVAGQAVKLGAPAPSVQRAIRSGACAPTPVVNVGGVITRSML